MNNSDFNNHGNNIDKMDHLVVARRRMSNNMVNINKIDDGNISSSSVVANDMNSMFTKFAFPFKLHSILENSGKLNQEQIISWLPSGKAFKIHKPKEFANVIMPQYFNQTKYRSFQRQLYIYGFDRHREKSSEDCGAYYHELFIRGVSDLCLDMQRKKIKGTGLSNEERRRKAQQESCVKKIIHNDTSSLMKKQTKKRKTSSSSSSSSSSSQKKQPKRSLLPPSLKTTKMMKAPSSSLSTATVPIAAAGVLSTAAPCFIPSMPLSISIATASSISSNRKQQENMMMAMLLNPSLDLQSSSSTKAQQQQLQQQQPPRRVSEWNNELKSFTSSVKPALNKQEIQHEQLQMQQQQRARSRRVSELMQMQSSIGNNGTNNNTISSGSSSSMTQKQATLHNCLSSEFGIPFDPTMGGRRCSLGFVRTAARRNSLLHDGEQIDFNNKKFFFTSQYN